ncbi:MAG TPA: hypothetical protein VJS64_06785 [Pyrinomonadaceae bacterium]|nr:hypothetical protein [Pyrinomonadaceae bacterium]
MPNLDALDTAIAVVIVILLLSLIVQSVQAIFKKLLKIKSRQLEQSLVDLFEHIIANPTGTAAEASLASRAATNMRKSPILQLLVPRAKHASELAGKDVADLYQAVVTRFKEIGRVSVAGKPMLDSISKADLLKVLSSVAPGSLLPNLVAELTEACQRVTALEAALKAIDINHLSGEASAKFAAMQDAIAPMLSNIRTIMSGAQLNPKLLLGDVIGLRQIELDDVLKLLGEVQKKVEDDIKAESGNPNGQRFQDLQNAAQGLKNVAATMIEVRQTFDAALAPVRVKLTEVDSWYDTVMQSFNERYARSMKTWAVVISFLVVIFLNANFFNIYRNISSNDVTRNLIIEAAPQLVARAQAETNQNQTQGQTTNTQTTKELLDSIQKIRGQLRNDADSYASLGFAPSTLADFRKWLSTWNPVAATDQTGKVIASGSVVWLTHRKADFRTLLGWTITALLLSVGAPFWQDTLESLFGIKSLLRKRGDIKNVEGESGAGQPKT